MANLEHGVNRIKEDEDFLLDQRLSRSLDVTDQEAVQDRFTAIYEAYHEKIQHHVRKIVRNPEEADEVTQDSFIRAYRALPRVFANPSELKLRPWLYRIATNTSFSHLRRQKHEITVPLFDVHTATDETPEEFSMRNAAGREALDAIDSLPKDQRMLFLRRTIHEEPFNDIVSLTGNNLSTAKVQVFRARKKVAEKLSQNGG
jgi:RNA polymerase sigma-70 factor (ECF subfamily)